MNKEEYRKIFEEMGFEEVNPHPQQVAMVRHDKTWFMNGWYFTVGDARHRGLEGIDVTIEFHHAISSIEDMEKLMKFVASFKEDGYNKEEC